MKLSIIVPVYNVEKYLGECLQSILSQINDECEVLCVEDCSTDNSLKKLIEFSEEYENIKILRHEINRGLSAARNTGLNNAKGQYVLFVDSDDMLKSNAISELMKTVEGQEVDQVFFNMEEFMDDDRAWPMRDGSYQDVTGVISSMELYEKLMKQNIIKVESCRVMYRLDFLNKNKIRFLEGILHEDNHFFYKCLKANGRVIDINKELYRYRHRSNSIMGQIYSGKMQKSIESKFIIAMDLLYDSKVVNGTEHQNKLWRLGVYKLLNNAIEQRTLCGETNELIIQQNDMIRNLYEFFGMKNELRVYLSEEKVNEIRRYKNVYVYGAGRIAGDIINKLQEENIRVDRVIVTTKAPDASFFNGYRLFVLDDMNDLLSSAIIVLAGNNKNRQSMKRELEMRNIKNYIEPEDV